MSWIVIQSSSVNVLIELDVTVNVC